jgi:hypothetical protein
MDATLVSVARLEVSFILIGMAIVVAYQMLTGRINVRGLLSDTEDGSFSVSRAQLLVLSLVGLILFIARVAGSQIGTLPDVPQELLLVVGGSNGVYLLVKGRRLLASLFKG